jgi:hypothetical protein
VRGDGVWSDGVPGSEGMSGDRVPELTGCEVMEGQEVMGSQVGV